MRNMKLFFRIVSCLFMAQFIGVTVVKAASDIQMLPPQQSGVACPAGVSRVLAWDGANPLSCISNFSVLPNGYVGIGTATPQNPLDVTGVIHTSQAVSLGQYLGYIYAGEAGGGTPGDVDVRTGTGSAANYFSFQHDGTFNILNGGLTVAGATTFNGGVTFNSYVTANQWIEFDGAGNGMNFDNTGLNFNNVNSNPKPTDTQTFIAPGGASGGLGRVFWFNSTGVAFGPKNEAGINADGSGYFGGYVTFFKGYGGPSDIRLKKDIRPITDALVTLEKLQGVHFNWRTVSERSVGKEMTLPVDKPQVGFIAQDVQKLIPEAVVTDKNGTLSLQETKIIPVLVEAVKELKQQTDKLQAANDRLGVANAALQQEIEQLQTIKKVFVSR